MKQIGFVEQRITRIPNLLGLNHSKIIIIIVGTSKAKKLMFFYSIKN